MWWDEVSLGGSRVPRMVVSIQVWARELVALFQELFLRLVRPFSLGTRFNPADPFAIKGITSPRTPSLTLHSGLHFSSRMRLGVHVAKSWGSGGRSSIFGSQNLSFL